MKLCFKQQYGFSIVELMVAMLIGLILMLGVTQLYVSSKQTARTNTALARVQETGRFAIETLSYSIRNAGYKGNCISLAQYRAFPLDSADNRLNINVPITVYKSGTTYLKGDQQVEGSDGLLVNYTMPGVTYYGVETNAMKGVIKTGEAPSAKLAKGINNYSKSSPLIVSSSAGCDVFVNGADKGSYEFYQYGKESESRWSNDYRIYFDVLPLVSEYYYIAVNSEGNPALFRDEYKVIDNSLVTERQELLEGVVELKMEYGIDENRDRIIDRYVSLDDMKQPADWGNVVAVRVYMVVTGDKNTVDENITLKLPVDIFPDKDNNFFKVVNGALTVKDKRMAQVFISTIAIRNKLP